MNWVLQQLTILPIVIPLCAGALLVLAGGRSPRLASLLAFAALTATFACALALVLRADEGGVLAYRLGNWAPPYGIALAVDRLGASMLLVVSVVAMACQLAATDGEMPRRPLFAALLQFQVMGLNGAFLTADLFNLFVFFEVLLIASYALLLQGGGREAVRASLHYVVINLVGSALFLLAVSLLYGVLGTLNLADLSQRIAQVAASDRAPVSSAVLLLVVVFGIKSALLPLGFWLPRTYRAASMPVAAMFAVMTKVGVYSLLRLTVLLPATDASDGAGALGMTVRQLLLWGGVATLLFGALLVLAARDLRALTCAFVASSAGTLLLLLGVGTPAALQAVLVYLPHTTFATAAMFLLAGLVATARGAEAADRMIAGGGTEERALLGVAFAVTVASLAGLPPLSGFVAKLFVLDSTRAADEWGWIWAAVLAGSLAALVALARAGSVLFWKPAAVATPGGFPDHGPEVAAARLPRARLGTRTALGWLLSCGLVIAVAATPIGRFAEQAARQLTDSRQYVERVLPATGTGP